MRNRFIGGVSAAWLIALAMAAPTWGAPLSEEPDLGTQAQPVGQRTDTDVWRRSNLFGDIGGLRTWMGNHGLSLGLTETSEYLYNTTGGLKTGGAYDGLTTLTLGLDTQKAFGWPGGQFNASFMNLHGSDLSQYNLGSYNTASGIELPQNWTRLWELWYDQSFLSQRFDVKVGQQSIDQEFMTSQNAALFVSAMMGWPGVPSYDMPSGGPAYPLSALGVRLRARITPSLTALVGVFDGDPLGNDPNNLRGTNFNVRNGTLFIGELQYSVNGGSAGSGLPGLYKFGIWYNTDTFGDLRYDNMGQPLARGGSTAVPQQHRGHYSIYAVADQAIWQPDPKNARALNIFARIVGAPDDRNLVNWSANVGLVLKKPFAGRDDDSFGIGLSYIRVGGNAVGFDRDSGHVTRSSETALEVTYQYQATPWWQIQPVFQYTIHPGAGQNPNDPLRSLGNTFVVGVRTNITF